MTSNSLTPKIIGQCSCCDEPLFEIEEIWLDGPYAGEPRVLGKPLLPAYRAEVICISGRHMSFTVCENCRDEPDLKLMYQKMLLAHHRERKNWTWAKAEPFDDRQMSIQTRESCKLCADIPIGVLYTVSWEEIHGKP